MTNARGLLAQLKRATQQTDSAVRLVSPAAEEPAPAPEATDDDADLLGQLDDLVRRQAAGRAEAKDAGEEHAAAEGTAEAPEAAAAGSTSQRTGAHGVFAPAAKPAGPLTAAFGVDLVNRTHFVAPLSGEATVWREGADPETGMYTVSPISQPSLRLEFAPIAVNVNTAGGVRSMPIADVWLRDKRRREYPGGVVFEPEGNARPGCFNMWRGFGVTRKAGDASPMVDHVNMLCSGVADLTEYVLNWLAFVVQRPGTRPEVALVLRGGQGTGKGTVFRVMLAIFGPHGLHITQPRHLTGNFNSHLRTTRFLFVDEGYWAGNKEAEGILKGLITEPTIAIEMKGRDVFTAQNRLALGMAANGVWVVPAGADERRYCVIDVPATRAQDHAYFGTLHAWIDGDGAAFFLDHLLSRDLSRFNVRSAPKTAALDRQKIEAMPSLDRWILEALDTAVGPAGDEWAEAPHRALCDGAAARFDTYCKRAAVRGIRADARAIGRRFVEVFGCGPATVCRIGATSRRGWTLPAISQARAKAAAAFGLAHYAWGQA